jgi:hypothetical protein
MRLPSEEIFAYTNGQLDYDRLCNLKSLRGLNEVNKKLPSAALQSYERFAGVLIS